MSNISIRKMRIFLAALEHKSFTKASVAQNITQPAATIIINQIEDEFQCELFERHGAVRKAVPTKLGAQVAETFSRIVASYDGEIASISQKTSNKSQSSRVLVQTGYDGLLNADWLESILDHFSEGGVRLEVLPRDQVLEEVSNRSADIGLIDGAINSENVDYSPAGGYDLVAAMSAASNHNLNRKNSLSLADLGSEFILMDSICPKLQKQVLSSASSSQDNPLKISRYSSLSAISTKLNQPEGIAVIPSVAQAELETKSNCTFHKFNDALFHGSFGLITPWGHMSRLPLKLLRVQDCFSKQSTVFSMKDETVEVQQKSLSHL